MENFLNFFLNYNTLIIEVLFALILLGALYLAVRIFTAPEEKPESSHANLDAIEESLKKLMQKSDQQKAGHEFVLSEEGGASFPTEASSQTGDSQALKEEIAKLQAALADKNVAIADLTAKLSTAQQSGSGVNLTGDAAAMREKIKDLQDRLDEYSIIEDDIADLSFFKEETVRLQDEIEKLKGFLAKYSIDPETGEGGVVPSAEVVSAQPPPKSEPKAEYPPGIENMSMEEQVATVIDDELMAEFAAAVAAQRSAEGVAIPKPEVATTVTASESQVDVPAETPEESAPVVDAATETIPTEAQPSEISAETVAVVAEPQLDVPATPPSVEANPLGEFDLEKMATEAQSLVETPADVSSEAVSALEQDLDTDKLLTEANAMAGDEKILAEFDEFVKSEKGEA